MQTNHGRMIMFSEINEFYISRKKKYFVCQFDVPRTWGGTRDKPNNVCVGSQSGGGGVAGIHVMSSCLAPHYLNLSTWSTTLLASLILSGKEKLHVCLASS